MKKVFALFLFVVSLLFVGCDADCKLEYTNALGEKEELTVTKTEDAETIQKVIYALAENQPAADFSTVRMNMKMKFNFAAKDSTGLSVSTNMDANAIVEANINTFDLYAAASLNYSTKDNDTSTAVKANGKIYKEAETVYLDASYKLANSESVALKYQMTMTQIRDLISQIGNSGDFPDIDDMIPDFEMPDFSSDESILALLKEYNVAITSTTSSTITFKIELPIEDMPNLKLDLFVVWDTKVGSLSSVKFEDDALLKALIMGEGIGSDVKISKSNISFELSLDYGNFKVTTVKESEKDKFLPVPDYSNPII